MITKDIIKLYIQQCYSPLRAMIGVPEILEIKNVLKKIECPKKCIVDLGGGDGLAASLIGNYFDINIDTGSHVAFKENTIYNKTIIDDITELKLDDNSQKFLTCISVIEHIEKWQSAIEHSYRVLENNGFLILTTPNKEFADPDNNIKNTFKYFYKKINKNHKKLFTIDELKQFLTKVGFKEVEVYGIGSKKIGYFWMFFRPLEFILPKNFLRVIIKNIACKNINDFHYKGEQSTTIISIARK